MPDEPLTYALQPGGRDGTEVLTLSGPFTMGNIFTFQRELQQMRPAYLIFEMSQVPYMDSAGLGLLMNHYVASQKNGRKMAIAGVTPRVRALFEMTKVDGVLPMFPTIEDAEGAA